MGVGRKRSRRRRIRQATAGALHLGQELEHSRSYRRGRRTARVVHAGGNPPPVVVADAYVASRRVAVAAASGSTLESGDSTNPDGSQARRGKSRRFGQGRRGGGRRASR